MEKLIGRKKELALLSQCMTSERSEFVVIYGRRRIGKTFLIRHFFRDKYTFHFVGYHNVGRREQLAAFAAALQKYSNSAYTPDLSDWMEAFRLLETYIERLPKTQRKVVVFDELPWMDVPKSGFVAALEAFWNGWAALRDDIFFVACGSSTSWIVKKVLKNRGGLYNRVTRQIYLRPFCLGEMEEYLESRGFGWDRFQTAQCYMTLGGVPYYLSLLAPTMSLAQNIDELFFSSVNAPLRNEFEELYAVLFRNAGHYIAVVGALAAKREGLTRQQISDTTRIKGEGLTTIIEDLERCDFIAGYQKFGSKQRNTLYRVTDFYTLFYYKFVNNQDVNDRHYWQNMVGKPKLSAWQGFSFELLCLLHIEQIKMSLGIAGVATHSCAWRSNGSSDDNGKPKGAQIDLLIDRADRIINLCEMKFSVEPYVMTKDYADQLRYRMSLFKAETYTRKGLAVTMVTTYGVLPGKNSGVVNTEVTLNDLFTMPAT